MSIEKVLVVDDELLMRDFVAETLRRKNLEVHTADSGSKALSMIRDQIYDLVITDMKMPDITGIDLLRKIKEASPNTLVVIITAFASIENAVEAMKLGAFNYLIKPFSPDTIEAIIEKAREHQSLVEENRYLRQQVSGENRNLQTIVGTSPVMQKLLKDVERIAKSQANIMITGESGTGKEVIAHAIHFNSLRSNYPFIKVNCAAVPDTLIESEFFGHEKGAFTGANNKRLGRFELAHQGTLLLDEITEVPSILQPKLLRAIQEQEFERVGGTKPVKVDVRIISTSNRNIQDMLQKKILREDLYYRLNVVPIHLPPLRDRREDIVPLANHFLNKICAENHSEKKELSREATQKLLDYEWPGNIRELANVIERAIVMNHTTKIGPEFLYIGETVPIDPQTGSSKLPVGITLGELEKRLIIETLHAQNNNRTRTAEILGISIRTLRNKLHEYRKDQTDII